MARVAPGEVRLRRQVRAAAMKWSQVTARPFAGPGRGCGRRPPCRLNALGDVVAEIGGAVATVVTLPFRALARLFGRASDTAAATTDAAEVNRPESPAA